MAPTKSRKSGKFPVSDAKSTKRCSVKGGCKNSDCGLYRQRILPKKKKGKEPFSIVRIFQEYRQPFMRSITFPVCIIASFIVLGHSDLIPPEQLCLECIFHGLTDYIREQSFQSSAATMIGGCGIWHFNSIVGDKLWTLVLMNGIQGFAIGMRYLLFYLTVFHVAPRAASKPVPIQLTLCIGILLFMFEYFTNSSNTFKRGVEDPLLLFLPFYKVVSYILFDDTNCWILESLCLCLLWMIVKECRRTKFSLTNNRWYKFFFGK